MHIVSRFLLPYKMVCYSAPAHPKTQHDHAYLARFACFSLCGAVTNNKTACSLRLEHVRAVPKGSRALVLVCDYYKCLIARTRIHTRQFAGPTIEARSSSPLQPAANWVQGLLPAWNTRRGSSARASCRHRRRLIAY